MADQNNKAIIAAARVLADRSADACGVNRDDNWKIYSDDFMADAKAALDAACFAATPAVPAVDALTLYKGIHSDGDMVMLTDVQALLAAHSTAPNRHPLADENGCWGLYAESVLAAAPEATSEQLCIDRQQLRLIALKLVEDGARSSENFRDGVTFGVFGLHQEILKLAGEQMGGAQVATYQVKQLDTSSLWADVSKAEFDASRECGRYKRIVYASPTTGAQVATIDQIKELALKHAAWRSKGRKFGVHFYADSLAHFISAVLSAPTTESAAAPADLSKHVRELAEKWNKAAIADGFAGSEPAYELFDLLDTPGAEPEATERKPLTDAELAQIMSTIAFGPTAALFELVTKVEQHHGITGGGK